MTERQFKVLVDCLPGCQLLLGRLLLAGDALRTAQYLSAPSGKLGEWLSDFNELLRVVKEIVDEY